MIFQGTTTVDIGSQLQQVAGGGVTVQTNLGTIIGSFIGLAFVVGGLLTLMYMILGAINWITAGGDTGKIDKARSKIIQGIVGLAVLVSVYAVFMVVQYFFGLDVLGSGGGAGGGGGTGGGGGNTGVCTPGQTASDGGAGGYCTSGAATVRCFGPGQGVSGYPYNHWEPCSCQSGSEKPGIDFSSC